VSVRKQLVLMATVVFGALGNVSLSHGMKQIGAISAARWTEAVSALLNPWVALGVLLLLAFFAAYLSSLSWADLSYVLPATSLGYVLLALLAQWWLHENVTPRRWVGILLISCGVAVVSRAPALTRKSKPEAAQAEVEVTVNS
jgi:drug/metabolite transporter (DMT)-like permease